MGWGALEAQSMAVEIYNLCFLKNT
jgi:hypothetical protein